MKFHSGFRNSLHYTLIAVYTVLCAILCGWYSHAAIPIGTVEIIAYNPYRLAIDLEVKCDYDWKTSRFRFHKFITVYGKYNTTIVVPNDMKKCQIWPKIRW